ncbi:RNA polymerase factor sigma-54, partial [Burkholderia pseudomallei]
MSATLALQMRQHLALTPRLQQSLRLLQLSSLEFQQELRQALDTNPFLEDVQSPDDDAAEAAPKPGETPAADANARADDGYAERDEGPFATDASPPAGQDVPLTAELSARGSSRRSDDASDLEPGDWMTAEPTLHEHLHDALRLCQLTRRDRTLARMIIDALDDDGYLRQALPELAAAADPLLHPAEQELLVALRLVQSLDQPGIGARTLSECLLLQLDAMPADTPGVECAKEIAAHHLERLARRETAEMQRRIGCDTHTLRIACTLVRRLDPRPGNQYGSTAGNYVVPDVIVRQ